MTSPTELLIICRLVKDRCAERGIKASWWKIVVAVVSAINDERKPGA